MHAHGSYSHDATKFYFYFLIVKSSRDGDKVKLYFTPRYGKGYYQVIYFFLLYNHIERERV